jgi:cobalt-zinc-cadmium efflux system outer membrane protein
MGAALLLAGCLSQDQVHHTLSGPLGRPSDVQAAGTIGPASTPLPPERRLEPPPKVEELPIPGGAKKDILRVPPELPGADAPELPRLPELKGLKPEEREKILSKIVPRLDPVGSELRPVLAPEGRPLTLADLQQMAAVNSPALRKAAADVVAARGAAFQAGAYPNPTATYQAQSFGPGGGPTVGGGLQQTIKTMAKLKLAQAAAEMDLANAEVALRAAQNDLATKVRSGYFAVVVAQENVLISHALADLTDAALEQQKVIVGAGLAAPYEPVQTYIQSEQARLALVQARNRYVSAWKQLAATLNRLEMPPTLLAGRADAPVPLFRYDQVLARVLANHTDVRTAENAVLKARYNLRLAEVTPIPDVIVGGTLFEDYSPPGPAAVVASVNVGMTVPVWDFNRGAILQARGQLAHAVEDLANTRNNLTQLLADAFERYENNRDQVARYRQRILGNQIRVYTTIRERYHVEPDKIAFADIFTSQQAVATVMQTYLTGLAGQWQAVVDVANLLQTDDLYQDGAADCGEAGPLLPDLLRLGAHVAEARRPATLLPPRADDSAATP